MGASAEREPQRWSPPSFAPLLQTLHVVLFVRQKTGGVPISEGRRGFSDDNLLQIYVDAAKAPRA